MDTMNTSEISDLSTRINTYTNKEKQEMKHVLDFIVRFCMTEEVRRERYQTGLELGIYDFVFKNRVRNFILSKPVSYEELTIFFGDKELIAEATKRIFTLDLLYVGVDPKNNPTKLYIPDIIYPTSCDLPRLESIIAIREAIEKATKDK